MWQAVCRRLTRRRQRRPGVVIEGPWQENLVQRQVRELSERYVTSDDHDRLALWLQHRDLRPVLSDLEKRCRS